MSVPERSACCRPASSFSGSVNATLMGSICVTVTSGGSVVARRLRRLHQASRAHV
jgi:hypothetical protein